MTVAETGAERSLFFMSRVAWFISTALIFAGDQFGWSWRSSTAAPDTCGAAIEVPESTAAPSPVPTPADVMSAPGAEMSGLRSFVIRAGPSDVKSVIESANPGIGAGSACIVTVVATVLKLLARRRG